MNDQDGSQPPRGNKTVFRPSPLQSLKQGGGAQPPSSPWGPETELPSSPQPSGFGGFDEPPQPVAPRGPALAPSRLSEDDVPLPATPQKVRNLLVAEAGPVLAMAAGIRSGRVRMALPQFHSAAGQAIAAFDRTIAPHVSNETRQRAKYALCSTIDDIAQNLPGRGNDGAEWARRSLVVQFFRENIGGDRFWQLVDEMLRNPAENRDLIELFLDCLSAGFEGRFRVMPDGRRRLHEIMARLQGALEHVRSLSAVELVPSWKGVEAPIGKVGFWTYISLAAAAAAAFLFLIYVVLQLILMQTGSEPMQRLVSLFPDERLTLSRGATAPAPAADSEQASRLRQFLQPEIDRREVVVVEDAQTVRVRTTVGQLFRSGSDQLEPGRQELFQRIGRAIEREPGPVLVEGHADSDRLSGNLSFPDNMALSAARAETVASVIRAELSDSSRVRAEGKGESTPIASNDTVDGKAQNRRVEIIVRRQY